MDFLWVYCITQRERRASARSWTTSGWASDSKAAVGGAQGPAA